LLRYFPILAALGTDNGRMGSAHIEDDDWFDDTEEDVDNRIEREDDDLIIVKTDNSPKLKSQMETLDRKKIGRGPGRGVLADSRAGAGRGGLVENMAKCSLSPRAPSGQVPLTPRTQRVYASPLITGRRVVSQIPRAAVAGRPTNHSRSPAATNPLPRKFRQPDSRYTERTGAAWSDIQPQDREAILLKGLLWVQQDRALFARWKERFVVLTSHYLQLYKKTSSTISEMGAFITKVRLAEVSCVSLADRRGYLTMLVVTPGSRLTLRKTEGIRAWHDALRRLLGRHRLDRMDRRAMETSEQFWERTIREEPQPSNRESLGSPRPGPTRLPSSEEDSGLESIKTGTSDSGSSSSQPGRQQASRPAGSDAATPNVETGDVGERYTVQSGGGQGRPGGGQGREKQQRGVARTEYSKFRAKLPFLTP